MINKDKDKIIGNINSKDAPEEIFTEGFSDLIAYNGIVKFNIFSRPIHSKELINTKKINKTLAFTSNNFEKFLEEINKEYNEIKNQIEKPKANKDIKSKTEEEKPSKGSRIL
jgi:hypothetical protein|tara:strand:+ start:1569 stop:1904 length:336 start_codon:yes stop_codon:yes gene_type:complete